MPVAKTWEQHKEEVQAVYDQAGKPWTVIGYAGEWKGNTTKIVACCAEHGEWNTTKIRNAKMGNGCTRCKVEGLKQRFLIPDSAHIAEFNKASPDNVPRKYYRSDRLDSRGFPNFWIYECSKCSHDSFVKAGVCSGLFEGTTTHLKKGGLACRCAKSYRYTSDQWIYRMTGECRKRGDQFVGFVGKAGADYKFKYLCKVHGEQTTITRDYLKGQGCPGCAGSSQQEFYINVILDGYGQDTGSYKLGIAKDSDKRLKGQNRNNNYTMQRVALFDLPSYQDCRALESLLKSKEVVPSIGSVERLHMKDGHSETFLREDLAIVLSAINQAGGIMRQEENYVS